MTKKIIDLTDENIQQTGIFFEDGKTVHQVVLDNTILFFTDKQMHRLMGVED